MMESRAAAQETIRNVTRVGEDDWFPIYDKIFYQTCCDCGLSHEVLVRNPGPDVVELRFARDVTLTEVVRENSEDDGGMLLYREVLRLREENAQLRAAALQQSDGTGAFPASASGHPADTRATPTIRSAPRQPVESEPGTGHVPGGSGSEGTA